MLYIHHNDIGCRVVAVFEMGKGSLLIACRWKHVSHEC